MIKTARCTSFILPDSSKIAYNYDGKHMSSIKRQTPSNQTLYEHQYTNFDENGHVSKENLIYDLGCIHTSHDILERACSQTSNYMEQKITFGLSGLVMTMESSLFGKKDYSYDGLNQITQEKDKKYLFDSLGNANNHKINDYNEILATEDEAFSYDEKGNPIERISPSGKTSYEYDAKSRMTCLIQSNKRKVYFTYDAFSRLLSKEIFLYKDSHWQKEDQVSFLYDQDTEIGSYDNEGQIQQLKILGLGIKQDIGATVAIELGKNVYAPLHDFTGHIIALVDLSKNIVESYEMDAYGREINSSSIMNPWRFCSKRKEEGFVIFQNRFYDPVLGRWFTPDPLGPTESMNLYVYVSKLSFESLRSVWSYF